MAFGVTDPQIQDAIQTSLEQLHPDNTAPQEPDYDEHHLVEYVSECIKESYEASKDRREIDEELWRAHETKMREMDEKEDWQSRIVSNTPYTTTLQATSIIRRGILEKPDFFSCEEYDEDDPMQQAQVDFWQQALKYWTQQPDVRFQAEFAGMSQVGFAVGQSQCLKFLWKKDQKGESGLKLTRFEPWKQYDDPDREPGRQWSGLYNIHEDWVDYHVLLQGQEEGFYINVDQIDSQSMPKDDAATFRRTVEEQRAEEQRKSGSSTQRNRFRKQILVREFWGSVLDEDGAMLYPNVTFTVANDRVIRPPMPVDFPTMRWPWVDFSPLPHPLRFHGYGLYEGALAMWKLKNQLLNLYLDNENFRINAMYEIYPEKLRNPADDEFFPGKKWIRKHLATEGAAIVPVNKTASNLADAQFIWALAAREWESGSFVNEFVKGQAGSGAQATATETTQKFQQSMGVFDSIGRDSENGAVACLQGMQEFLQTYWHNLSAAPFRKMTQTNPIAQAVAQGLFPQERIEKMALSAKMRIRGISKAFEQSMIAQKLQGIATMASTPIFGPFFKPYRIAKMTGDCLQLPETVKTEDEMKQEQQAQQAQMVQQAVESAKQAALEKSGLKEPGAQPKPGEGAPKGTPQQGGAPPQGAQPAPPPSQPMPGQPGPA